MKRFLCLFTVVFVLISCFVPAVFASDDLSYNTVATSTDIYLNGFCGSNSDGTITAPCSVVGGFPLGFVRHSDPNDQQPAITYWQYYNKWAYYRIDLGTIGTGVTNCAFNFRILDELGSYLYNTSVYDYTLKCYAGNGRELTISDLEWFWDPSSTFTGHTYSTLTFNCIIDTASTAFSCYFVLGIHYKEATIPAYVSLPQYKWSGPVNGFGSTYYQDIDIYQNGTTQWYVPYEEATYMEACYDAYNASNLFSYFGSGMLSQVIDLGTIIRKVNNESLVLQAQNEALAGRIIYQVNQNVDAAEESINANLDEESQNIQGAIGEQTSELESYFQPIIDHYDQVDEVGQEIGDNINSGAIDSASSDVSSGVNIASNIQNDIISNFDLLSLDFSRFGTLLMRCLPVFFNFGVNVSPFRFGFIFLIGFLFVFFIIKVIRGE